MRALGLGVNNAMSRVGALLSPFMAVALVERGMPHAAEGIIAAACVLAAVATLCLPLETAGKALLVRKTQTLLLKDPPVFHIHVVIGHDIKGLGRALALKRHAQQRKHLGCCLAMMCLAPEDCLHAGETLLVMTIKGVA